MKTTVKILLIVLALAAIGVVGWLTFFSTSQAQVVHIDDTFFSAQIQEQTATQIDSASSFADAKNAFNDMMLTVNDAAFLQNIDTTESANCKALLAEHFAPSVISHAETTFAGHEWNNTDLDDIKAGAEALLAGNLLTDADKRTKLNEAVKNVNDYHAARSVAQCGSCHTVADAKNAINKAAGYNRAPLNNCTSLKSALDAVPNKAKQTLAENIIHEGNSITASSSNFESRYNAVLNRISEYKNAFGNESQFAAVKSHLNAEKGKIAANKRKAERDAYDREVNSNRHHQQSSGGSHSDDDDDFVF